MKTLPNILVIFAHAAPHRSRVNHRMATAAATLSNVQVHDLYDTYPDFYIDVKHEQARLEMADLVVVQHPIQWYGTPSLLKEWFDVVLEHGWAHGPGGDRLQGKQFWLATTTGGSAESYHASGTHQQPFPAFLHGQEQMARLCGMHWLSPYILHGAHQIDEETLAQHVAGYVTLLRTYPDWAHPPQVNHGT